MKSISLKDLLEAGCHFGHQTTRWNPKMKPYIYMARDRIHIFDLVQTKAGLEAAAAFAKATASQGGQIIIVGTKRQSQPMVRELAEKVTMPFVVERWVGGLLTNWDQVKKRINRLKDLKAGRAEGRFNDRTKKERLLIDREITKLERIFGGVAVLNGLPAAVFVTDVRKDAGAVKEAFSLGIKVIAIVDTNANPDGVDYLIPANDDATKCLQLIIGYLGEAIEEGKKNVGAIHESPKEEKPKKRATKKVAKKEEGVTK